MLERSRLVCWSVGPKSRQAGSSHHHCHTTAMLTHSATVSPLPLPLGLSLRAVWIFCYPLLTTPFMSNLDTLSGCLSGMCLFPPFPLAWCPQISSSPSSSHLVSFFPHGTLHEQPWCAAWLLRWGCSFLPLLPVAFTICLTCVVDHCWSTLLSMSVHQCTAYLSECVFFCQFCYGLCGDPSLHVRPHWTRNSLGWRPLE
jgi:hypothetical protein